MTLLPLSIHSLYITLLYSILYLYTLDTQQAQHLLYMPVHTIHLYINKTGHGGYEVSFQHLIYFNGTE
jgi:hypothetical protein